MGRPKLIKVDVVDGRGLGGAKQKTVTVQRHIPDILAFRDTPGFAYLLLAANINTPMPVLQTVLEAVGEHQMHPKTWMYKRRELFKTPALPPNVNPRAVDFIRENMRLPAWKLHTELRKRGIKCSTAQVHRIWMAISYQSVME